MICCRLKYFYDTFDCEPATQLNIAVVLGRVGGEAEKEERKKIVQKKKVTALTIQAGLEEMDSGGAGADNRHE